MKNMQIKSNTEKDHKALLTLLYSFGYVYNQKTLEDALVDYCFDWVPVTRVNLSSKTIRGNSDYANGFGTKVNFPEDFMEIYDYITDNVKTPIIVKKLSLHYNAVVHTDKIEVGCQTIPMEKFQEIAAAVTKFNS